MSLKFYRLEVCREDWCCIGVDVVVVSDVEVLQGSRATYLGT